MRLPKLRELREALASAFSAPDTTKFPAVPERRSEAYRGRPRYDPEACVGCGACALVCPPGAIILRDDAAAGRRELRLDLGRCIQCGLCHEHCITERGIVNTTEDSPAAARPDAPDLAEVVVKELVLCEICGQPVGSRDHLFWIRDRLGAKAYAHPVFVLLTQERLTGLEEARPKSRLRREDQMKISCAKCRQRIVNLDEFRTG